MKAMLLLSASMVAAFSGSAQAATEIEQIVVLPVVVTAGIAPDKGPLLDGILINEVSKRAPEKIKLLGSKDVSALLGHEQQKQMLGCDDQSCLVEIGNALGASHLLSLTMGRIGQKFIINTTLLDVASTDAVFRDTVYLGETEEELLQGVATLSDRLALAQGWQGAVIAAQRDSRSASEVDSAEVKDAGEISPLLWIGTGVAGVGLLAAGGFGIATFLINDHVAQNRETEDTSGASTAGLGTIIGTGLGGVAVAAGAILAGLALMEGE